MKEPLKSFKPPPQLTGSGAMKVLIASTPQKFRRTKRLWEAFGKLACVQHEILGEDNFRSLGDLADRMDFARFDRVIIDHNLRRMGTEYKHLRRIPRLVIFDFDFCQNYVPGGGSYGKLESVLRTLNEHRIVISSLFIKRDLQAKGFDAEYSPKAYDTALVHDLGLLRDIRLGFIGRSNHRVYRQRKDWLARLTKDVGLQVFRTEENAAYNHLLNRIQIFICPDLAFHELMIKNFEALAAGCVLVTGRPGRDEADYLGFLDGENVVLFESYDELLEKLRLLQQNPGLSSRIAVAGRELAVSRHSWEARAEPLLQKIQPTLRVPPPLTWRDRWNLLVSLNRKSKYLP